MKKIVLVFSLLCFAFLIASTDVKAALTEAQQNNIVQFSRDFVRDGNAAGLLQYGGIRIYQTYQLRLVYSDTNYVTFNNKRVKVLWMMNPGGYPNYDAYYADLVNKTGGYLVPGDYLVLDCSGFMSLMYKHVFGLRFDYVNSNHLSVWTTKMYYDNPQVTTYDGTSSVSLFEQIYARDAETKFPASSVPTADLQPGDIVVGYDETTEADLGHIMMYTGDGNVIHSSSVPVTRDDGTISPYLMREQPLSTLTNNSYTTIRVYRISDGVLNPAFEGYTNRVDFSSLTTDDAKFDTKAPEIANITVTDVNNRKLITVTSRDEYGSDDVVRLASNPNVVMKSSGFGESGVLGVYVSKSAQAPTDMYTGWGSVKGNRVGLYREPGTYYVWVKDAADNISKPWRVVVGDVSTVEKWPFELNALIGSAEYMLEHTEDGDDTGQYPTGARAALSAAIAAARTVAAQATATEAQLNEALAFLQAAIEAYNAAEVPVQLHVTLTGPDGAPYINGMWSNYNVTASAMIGLRPNPAYPIVVSRNAGATWEPYTAPITVGNEGVHDIWFQAANEAINDQTHKKAIVRIDKTAPELRVALDQTSLWLANHKMITVNADVYGSDRLSGIESIVLASITSNEPDNGQGDGSSSDDIQNAAPGTLDLTFDLRAERSGQGTGRVYTITYTAADKAGNKTPVSVTVIVPH